MNTTQNDAPLFFRVKEAAILLNISPDTLRRWLARGDIQGIRLGRLWLVPRSVIESMARDG